jgi:hypothetical protein
MKIILAIVLAASVAGCLTASQGLDRPNAKYDASWYRANGWSGEYPDGFTIASNVTIKIRGSLNSDAPKSISCMLRKNATYHQWNKKRVISDQLEFISFTKIETYELSASFTVELRRQSDGDDTTIQFKKGDQWLYLASLAEGTFLIKFNDTIYIADQDLYEKSAKAEAPVNRDESTYDEWLKLDVPMARSAGFYLMRLRMVPTSQRLILLGTALPAICNLNRRRRGFDRCPT